MKNSVLEELRVRRMEEIEGRICIHLAGGLPGTKEDPWDPVCKTSLRLSATFLFTCRVKRVRRAVHVAL